MNESEIRPIVVLVAVDDLGFASLLVQILRSSALFPIKAAITKSLDQVMTYVNMNEVDVVLLDTWLSDYPHEVAIERLRKVSDTPAIVLSRSTKMDVTDPLKRLGAQGVLTRSPIDPTALVQCVTEVLEASNLGKQARPSQTTGQNQSNLCHSATANSTDETKCNRPNDMHGKPLDDSCSSIEGLPVTSQDISMANLRLSGALRLKQVLSGSVPEKKQQAKLRKRLFKPRDRKKD
jgi:DNA-binding NarL/FixJ family response regulator